jgi:hypothetical protein
MFFFRASEKQSIHVYGTEIKTEMDYQGHNCTTMVGEK